MKIRPHWRKMTWLMILWVGATITFIILVNNVGVDETRGGCIAEAATQLDRETCDAVATIAAAAWTVIAVVLGTIGFGVLTVIWFGTRRPALRATWPPPPQPEQGGRLKGWPPPTAQPTR